MTLLEIAGTHDRSPSTASNSSSATRRSSIIYAASTSGAGRLALSSRLSSLSQVMSRLRLSCVTSSWQA